MAGPEVLPLHTESFQMQLSSSRQVDSRTLDRLLLKAGRRLQARYPELLARDVDAERIRDLVGTAGADAILDYSTQAIAFNRAYFFKNLYKSMAAIQAFAPLLHRDDLLMDVGAGGGVFALAWFLNFKVRLKNVVLVDRSDAQLRIAARVLTAFGIKQGSFVTGDYNEMPQIPTFFRLFSFWCCEQRAALALAGTDWWQARLNSRGLIVDYEQVIDTIVARNAHAYRWQRIDLVLEPSESVVSLVQDRAFSLHAAAYEQRKF
jgi:hypothetical protein